MVNSKYFHKSHVIREYRNFSNATETNQETLDRKLVERNVLIKRNGEIDARLPILNASYSDWAAAGDYGKAHEMSGQVTILTAEKNANIATIDQLNTAITALQDSIAEDLKAKQAANAAALAQANLTPAERLDLEKQAADLKLKQDQLAAQVKLEQEKNSSVSTNKKMIIYGSIAIAALIVIGIFIKILKSRTTAVTA